MDGLEIAVIGMACRFPGAGNIHEYWENLKNGRETIHFFTEEELERAGVSREKLGDPNFVKAGGVIQEMEYFDAAFFGYTAVEAQIMDPQVRIFHETAWHALEDAGYYPAAGEKIIGCYAGASANFTWEARAILSGKYEEFGAFTAGQFTDKDFLPTLVAYRLNLKGPGVLVQTACSTSLVAIHHACQGLLSGEYDMALAGGVTLLPQTGYLYHEGMIASPDGHCRAFDKDAQGTVPGNGVGAVVLKSLEDALAEGDYIYAIIKGSSINNDGASKAGFTAPSIEGQATVIRNALQAADVEPESIGYVETHGTGTPLGDPIEIEGLKLAFNTDKEGFCRIGSVKTNFGHLDAAAGVAGFIKTVLALKHRQIPPSLHFKTPNPKIDFENSPFRVNTETVTWETDKFPLRAGVSSFGIGGTNAHVILEEAPVPIHGSDDSRQWEASKESQLILLSARTASALEKATENLLHYFKNNPGASASLPDAAYTLQVGRRHFSHRRALVCSTTDELVDALASENRAKTQTNIITTRLEKKQPLVFLFPGQGAQYIDMGLDLYRKEPLFRQEMDRCFKILTSLMNCDIKQILYPSFENNRSNRSNRTDIIDQTEIAQPLIFAFEFAFATLLISWGIEPDAMMGHSIGEYTAACLAGVFPLEDALELVALRGRLMQQMQAGAMLSLAMPEEDLKTLLTDDISLAAVNSPCRCVVSGPCDAIDAFETEIKARGIESTRLHTSHAFHSRMMDPILEPFKEKVAEVKLNKTGKPYISNVSGRWITTDQAVDPLYWARHLRETVRFSDGIKLLLAQEDFVIVEVGPGNALSTMVKQHDGSSTAINLVRHPRENMPDRDYLLNSIGHLWLYGVTIDWRGFNNNAGRRRVPLPGYPFERERYWLDGELNFAGISSPALPMGSPAATAAASPIISPHRPSGSVLEQTLVEIWKKLFGFEKISIDDDFFELGGDSLKALNAISFIHKELAVKISLEKFLGASTLRNLAAYIDTAKKDLYHAIDTVEKKEYYPLSSAQKRLYILHEFEKESIGYNETMVFVWEGELDLELLTGALEKLINRHEILRTAIEIIGDTPVQRVLPTVTFAPRYSEAHENEVDTLIKNFIRPFDLSKPPLFRIGVIKIAEGRYVLINDIHHIVSDGVSINIFTRDFIKFYLGKEGELPGMKVQYKDYTEWQQEPKARELLKKQQEYWFKEFAAEIPLLSLPVDYIRPAVQSFEGSNVNFEISKEMTVALKRIGAEIGATLYMVLLALYTTFLAKISGQEDIVVGAPTAGRRHADLQENIGMFVNTLALRNYPIGEKKFIAFLGEVKERTLSAFENQDYPFEDLVELAAVNRDAGRNPLFDTLFVLQNTGSIAVNLPGVRLLPYVYEDRAAKFDLTLTGMEWEDKLLLTFQYSTSLFDRETIDRFIIYFENIVSRVIENKEQRISEIEIIPGEERCRLIYEFNDAAEYSIDKTIHCLFEEQALKTPDHVALVGAGSQTCPITLTYSVLHKQSDDVAGVLIEKGVLVDDVVGIKMERSIDLIIGILGILKSGGAYLPIEPGYPKERIDYMMKDSGTKLLVNEKFFGGSRAPRRGDPIGIFQKSPPVHASLAYIIYTSGSTGNPKGILTTHANVIRVVRNTNYIELTRDDRILQLSNYAFDGSAFDIYGALLNGAALVLVDKETVLAVDRLAALIRREQVTVFFVTTALFNTLVDLELTCLANIRKVLFGGERISVEHSRKALDYMGSDRIIHVYGPTETTVYATYYNIDQIPEGAVTIPIGMPIANTTLYIFDKYLNLAPIGISGEIYIGGKGVARGYLNNPELTAERFINNRSYGTYKTHIFYKTGDLARWLNDSPPAGGAAKGVIEFLGRIDQQVKIRGFRIELGEIETRLLEIDGVKEAVVIIRENRPGEKNLCAYVTIKSTVSPAALSQVCREYLVAKLPDYMIPSYFVVLEKIPLTPNGKIDQEMLPPPEIEAGEDYIAPKNEIEMAIVYIISKIIGIDAAKISVGANLFNIGVNSITLLKIAHRISQEFNIQFPLSIAFSTPTIEKIAERIQKGFNPTRLRRTVLLNRGTASKNMFILTGDGTVYGMKDLAGLLEDHYNVYGIQARGIMDTSKLPGTMKEVLDEYFTEIKIVQPEPPYLLGGHCIGSVIAYELALLLENNGDHVQYVFVLNFPAFLSEFFLDHFKIKQALDIIKTIYRNVKKLVHKRSRGGKEEQEDELGSEKMSVFPEDLEARRLEVARNFVRLFNNSSLLRRILNTPIKVFKALENEDSDNTRWNSSNWAKMSIKTVKIIETPGDHFNMFKLPHAAVLAAYMIEELK